MTGNLLNTCILNNLVVILSKNQSLSMCEVVSSTLLIFLSNFDLIILCNVLLVSFGKICSLIHCLRWVLHSILFFKKLFSCLNLGQISNMHSVAYQIRQVYQNVYQNEVHFIFLLLPKKNTTKIKLVVIFNF